MKGPNMPHHNLPLELIFAGSIWLTAIVIFSIMLIAALVSLRSSAKTEAKPKSVDVSLQPKRKNKDRP
jgi:hypothetical protein